MIFLHLPRSNKKKEILSFNISEWTLRGGGREGGEGRGGEGRGGAGTGTGRGKRPYEEVKKIFFFTKISRLESGQKLTQNYCHYIFFLEIGGRRRVARL